MYKPSNTCYSNNSITLYEHCQGLLDNQSQIDDAPIVLDRIISWKSVCFIPFPLLTHPPTLPGNTCEN